MATGITMDKGIPSIRLNGVAHPASGHHFPGGGGSIMINAPVQLQPPARPFQRFISSTTVVQRNHSSGSAGSSHHSSHGGNDELLDDSLTNLNWLQSVKLGVLPGATPPSSPRNGVVLKGNAVNGVNAGIVAIQHPGSYQSPYATRPPPSQLIKQHQQQHQQQLFISSNNNGEHHHHHHHHLVEHQQPTGNEWTHMETNHNFYQPNHHQSGHVTLPPICTVMEPAPASSLDQLISGTADPHTAKPSYSYSQLIYFALTSSPEKPQMSLQEIYDWIVDNFPYYRTADPAWQSSVRHNLSLNRCFERVSRKRSGPDASGMSQKSSLWQLSRNYAFLLDSGASDVGDEGELSPRRRFGGFDPLEEPSKRLKVSGDLTDLFGPELLSDILSAESALFSDLAPDSEHPALMGAPPAFNIPPLNISSHRGANLPDGATPSSEGETDSFEELLLQDMVNEMNGQAPVDLLTGEALDLTVTGVSLRPPADWWGPEILAGAELLMGPPPSQNHPMASNANNNNHHHHHHQNHGHHSSMNNNANSIDPLVNSLTASFFASDGSIWANADWDPESLDTFQPAAPNSSNK